MMTQRQIRRRSTGGAPRGALIGLALAIATTGVGCRESKIRTYEVPAERVAPPPVMPPPSMSPTGAEVPHWQLPAGWQEVPGTGMRFATLIVEAGNPPLEIRVTPLTLAAGDLLDNVNRWREQIALEPVSAMDVGKMVKSIDAGGRTIDYVNLTGPATSDAPARQILAAILPGSQQLWFFLMFDDSTRVSRHAAEFEAFIGTVHLAGAPEGSTGHPDISDGHGSTPTAPAAPGEEGAESMTWSLPGGWTVDPTPRDMRVATIKLSEGGGEVAITRFAGPGGDLMANINRWRSQLGLAPVAAPTDQPSESIELAGFPARLFDISEGGSDPARKRRNPRHLHCQKEFHLRPPAPTSSASAPRVG